jgi:hypothetical protein
MRRIVTSILLAVSVFAGGEVAAHRFHASLADVSHNARTGNLEVVINLMAHDVEALLAQGGQANVDLGEAAGEALVRQYMQHRFQLLGKDGKALPLAWVGMKVNADTLVVYQELENSGPDAVARIRNSVLVDLLPNQENSVNFKGATYTFDREKVEASVR